MTLLAPAFFVAALAVAMGAVALHFLVTRQPPSESLPTARFVPSARVEVTTIARRPEDLLLLLVRVLLVLLVGAAFARPVLSPLRRPVARVVLTDASHAVADTAALADSVRRIAAKGDPVIRFTRLSSGLIAGIRAGAELRSTADSLELVIVSPLDREVWDGATATIRALWPGRIRLVTVAGRADSSAAASGIAVRGEADDAVVLAATAAGMPRRDSLVRVVRLIVTAAESAWARNGGALVEWPSSGAPGGWRERGTPDTAGAVVAGDVAVVFPFERRWRADPADTSATVLARWVDGEPAAVEHRLGAGCVRSVAIPVPARGDLILRPDFARLLGHLAAPCGMASRRSAGPPDPVMLAGRGPLASKAKLPAPEVIETPLVPWLLAAALLLALLELRIRRPTTRPESRVPA